MVFLGNKSIYASTNYLGTYLLIKKGKDKSNIILYIKYRKYSSILHQSTVILSFRF